MRRRTAWMLITAGMAMSCGGADTKPEQSPQIQGKPPTAATDPFFYIARPPESAKADTQGTIGDSDDPESIAGPTGVERGSEQDGELNARLARAEAALDAAEARNVELAARTAELEVRLAEATPGPTSSVGAQCFACVKICPVSGHCGDDAEMVCGWGKGKSRKDAMIRATAECDGALNGVRNSGMWSRVDGNCPIATCS